MSPKKTILLIARKQFGYSNVYYFHCKYLSRYFHIRYFCPDMGYDKIEPEYDVDISFINFQNRNKLIRNIHFQFAVIREVYRTNADLTMICSGFYSTLIRLFLPFKNYTLDIRVGHKGKNKIINSLYRLMIRFNIAFFGNITILSTALAEKLGLKKGQYTVVPLGSEILAEKEKSFENLHLFYIGAFNNRNLTETIQGFAKFYREMESGNQFKYTIAGFGSDKEIEAIKQSILENKMEKAIQYIGKLPLLARREHFDNHNVGVSYIPKTELFDVQPPTKTYEYILAGMPVLATSTSENVKVVNEKNGILIEDTPDDFYRGLKELYSRRLKYKSETIRNTMLSFSWLNVVDDILYPYLNDIIEKKR